MTTERLATLNEITDNMLGAEHTIAVISARTEARNWFLTHRERVTGTVVLDGVALRQMDSLDAMVGQWIVHNQRAVEATTRTKEAVDGAVNGELPNHT